MSGKLIFPALMCIAMLAGASAFHIALADAPAAQPTAAVETVEAPPPCLTLPASLKIVGGSID